MKLTFKKLEKLVEEVLKEISSGGSSTGETADFESQLEKAKDDLQQHQESEPTPKSHTKERSDKTKWIHPYSAVTHDITKASPQPSTGWQYRQATDKADTSRWIHPYSSAATTLGKGQKQPPLGWQDVPGKGVKGKTTYGQGDAAQHKKTAVAKGYTRSDARATTNPTTTTYATAYGQGSKSDYTTDTGTAGRDQFTEPKATTHPTEEYEETRPSWEDWNSKTADLEKAVSDAEQALSDAQSRAKDPSKADPKQKAKQKTGASMGRSRPGKIGKGQKGLGKKGKGKKASGGRGGGLKGGGFG